VPLWIRVRLTLKHSFIAQEFLKRAFENRDISRARTNVWRFLIMQTMLLIGPGSGNDKVNSRSNCAGKRIQSPMKNANVYPDSLIGIQSRNKSRPRDNLEPE
jgi:hypothetical protein